MGPHTTIRRTPSSTPTILLLNFLIRSYSNLSRNGYTICCSLPECFFLYRIGLSTKLYYKLYGPTAPGHAFSLAYVPSLALSCSSSTFPA
jgi:hypothetical protein